MKSKLLESLVWLNSYKIQADDSLTNRKRFSIVCTLLTMDLTSQNVQNSSGITSVALSIRVQTMENHLRFLFYNNKVKKTSKSKDKVWKKNHFKHTLDPCASDSSVILLTMVESQSDCKITPLKSCIDESKHGLQKAPE